MKSKLPLVIIVLAATLLRIYLITRDSVPFAYDMGRDLLWAKDISFYHIPTLIGPAASIWGVYFGPLWYYFLSIPLLISGGNPLSAVFVTASTIILTGALAYFLFFKYIGKQSAFILAIIILFSATLISISTFAFHANLLPLLTFLTIYFCFLAIVKNPIYISLSFLFVSLMFHADPAPAVVFTSIPMFVFWFFKLYKKNLKKVILTSFLLYLLPFLPQIIFELRNDFIQTRSLVAYFSGYNPSLSGQLPFFERITNRLSTYYDFFTSSFSPNNNAFSLLLIGLIILGSYKIIKVETNKNLKVLHQVNLISLVLSFAIFTFPITVEIKYWYLYGLPIILAFLITNSVAVFRKFHILTLIFLIVFLTINLKPHLLKDLKTSGEDPASLNNQLEAIDLINNDSTENNYSVFVYTPSIYDHNFQYLFWWQGVAKKGELPELFAYLPNKPDYVRNKHLYAQNGKISDEIYLIIENSLENEYYTKKNWLREFENYNLIWEKDINNALTVQKKSKK